MLRSSSTEVWEQVVEDVCGQLYVVAAVTAEYGLFLASELPLALKVLQLVPFLSPR